MAEGEGPPAKEPAEESSTTEAPREKGNTLLDATKKAVVALTFLATIFAAIGTYVVANIHGARLQVVSSLVIFAVLMAAGVGSVLFLKYRARKVTTSTWQLGGVLIIAICLGIGLGYLVAGKHSDPSPKSVAATTPASTSPTPVSTASASNAQNSATGFTAEVEWTNDGAAGQTYSTNLITVDGPNSHIHKDVYLLGDKLTVICQVPNGRAIQVGPDYKGPSGTSTVWYELDDGSWAPAVYVHVDQLSSLPECS